MKTEHSRKRLLRTAFVLLSFLSLAVSCMEPSLEEVTPSKALIDENIRSGNLKVSSELFALPAMVSLNQVDLYLDKGSAATGTVTVEIRDVTGGTTISSVTVTAASLAAGSSWKTFTFAPAALLERDHVYRIYLKRSDPHNYATNNYFFWRTSSGGVDAYPGGINDVAPAWTLDYAFKTYTEGGLDQQQTSTNYGFFVDNSFWRWQEFKADYPKVILTYVDLNLYVGSAMTGSVILQIRNEDGSSVLAATSISSLPAGTYWKKFKLGATLYRDQKYRIYVTRSNPHNYSAGDYVFWKTSSGGADVYPDGSNDTSPGWVLDYAFRTYSAVSGVDQQQNLNTYGFFTSSGLFRWQEFVPRHQ
jgi:hypothetical protein